MKKYFIAVGLLSASSWVCAQGYVGAVVALTKLQNSCVESYKCNDSRGHGFKIFGGTRFNADEQLSLGGVGFSRIEVAAMRFGKQASTGTAATTVISGGNPVPATLAAKSEVSADALVVAAGMDWRLSRQLVAVGKVGLAYVTGTLSSSLGGVSNGSVSNNAIRPYLGLAMEIEVLPNVQVQGGFDWTRYSVDGRSGSATQLGLGAAVSF